MSCCGAWPTSSGRCCGEGRSRNGGCWPGPPWSPSRRRRKVGREGAVDPPTPRRPAADLRFGLTLALKVKWQVLIGPYFLTLHVHDALAKWTLCYHGGVGCGALADTPPSPDSPLHTHPSPAEAEGGGGGR